MITLDEHSHEAIQPSFIGKENPLFSSFCPWPLLNLEHEKQCHFQLYCASIGIKLKITIFISFIMSLTDMATLVFIFVIFNIMTFFGYL